MSFYKLSKQPLPPCQDSFMKTMQETKIIIFVSVAFFMRLQALCWLHFSGIIMIFLLKSSFYLYAVTVFSELSCNNTLVIWTDNLVKYSVQRNSDPRVV